MPRSLKASDPEGLARGHLLQIAVGPLAAAGGDRRGGDAVHEEDHPGGGAGGADRLARLDELGEPAAGATGRLGHHQPEGSALGERVDRRARERALGIDGRSARGNPLARDVPDEIDQRHRRRCHQSVSSLERHVIRPARPTGRRRAESVFSTVNNSPLSAVSGGYLAKPSNIYAEPKKESNPEHSPVKEPIFGTAAPESAKEEDPSFDMQLVVKDDIPAADEPLAHQIHINPLDGNSAEEPAMQDIADEQKRRAAERINKLRNLSFNINAADPNNEFETVPAYVRRNLELYNTVSPAQDFYSNYEVKADEKNNGSISTLNTFLDGKKPD